MAVNLTNADKALKTLYLDVVTEQLNKNANPLLAKIKSSSNDVWGKEVKKLADQVQASAVCESGTGSDSQVLEVIGGKITPTYTLKFPAEFFLSEAIMNVTPVIVYDGGEVVGQVLTLQGDKIMDNYNVISYKKGGEI